MGLQEAISAIALTSFNAAAATMSGSTEVIVGGAGDIGGQCGALPFPWPSLGGTQAQAGVSGNFTVTGNPVTIKIRTGGTPSLNATPAGTIVHTFVLPVGVTFVDELSPLFTRPTVRSYIEITATPTTGSATVSVTGLTTFIVPDTAMQALAVATTDILQFSTTVEIVRANWLVNFDLVDSANLLVDLAARTANSVGETGTFSLRLGGTVNNADGTVLLSYTDTTGTGGDGHLTGASATITKPTGTQLVKLSVKSTGGFSVLMRGCTALFKAADVLPGANPRPILSALYYEKQAATNLTFNNGEIVLGETAMPYQAGMAGTQYTGRLAVEVLTIVSGTPTFRIRKGNATTGTILATLAVSGTGVTVGSKAAFAAPAAGDRLFLTGINSAATNVTYRMATFDAQGDPAYQVVVPPLLVVPPDDSVLGRDIDVLDGLPPNLTLVSGRRNLAQAIARRFMTPEGFLRDFTGDDEAGDYGYDLRSMLNAALSADDIASMTSLVQAQCLQDPRINDADVAITFDLASSSLTIVMTLDTDDGPVPLVLKVDALTVAILDGQAA